MEMILQTTELCKSFKKQKAVNKVSLNRVVSETLDNVVKLTGYAIA